MKYDTGLKYDFKLSSDGLGYDYIIAKILIEIFENLPLLDEADFNYAISILEELVISEYDVQTATNDFYIGSGNYYGSQQNFVQPFDMIFDKGKSNIPCMPTTETSFLSIPSVDGSIMYDTIYINRLFSIVMYTVSGLNQEQKELVKEKISVLLDATKGATKKFTLQSNDITFDVKYSGEPSIQEAPSFVRATIPFEASPYGYNQFEEQFLGSGTITNSGHARIGVTIEISGGCIKPNFKIDEFEFFWNGTVPTDKRLVIDNEDKTCYLLDQNGNQAQAMTQLEKGQTFKLIESRSIAKLTTLNASTEQSIFTRYKPLYLWKRQGDVDVE